MNDPIATTPEEIAQPLGNGAENEDQIIQAIKCLRYHRGLALSWQEEKR